MQMGGGPPQGMPMGGGPPQQPYPGQQPGMGMGMGMGGGGGGQGQFGPPGGVGGGPAMPMGMPSIPGQVPQESMGPAFSVEDVEDKDGVRLSWNVW